MRTHSSLSLPFAGLAYYTLLSLVYIVGKDQYSSLFRLPAEQKKNPNLLLPWLLLLLMPPGYFLSFGPALRSKREREREREMGDYMQIIEDGCCRYRKILFASAAYTCEECLFILFLAKISTRAVCCVFVCVRTDGGAAAGSSGGCSVSAWLVARRCVLYMRNPHKELLQRYPPRRRHYHWIELRRVLLVTRSFASPFFIFHFPLPSLSFSLSPV